MAAQTSAKEIKKFSINKIISSFYITFARLLTELKAENEKRVR